MPGHKCLLSLFLVFLCSCSFAEKCEDCWTPKFNFELEDRNFIETMIFISGHSYSLSGTNKELDRQGKDNFFCKNGSVGSNELIDILNSKLSGRVSAEKVNAVIINGLLEKYPCSSSDK